MSIIEKLGITKGLWIVEPHEPEDSEFAVCSKNDSKYRNGNIYQSDWIAEFCADNTDGGVKTTNKNANLIASAPEMLEALIEDCLSFSKGLETDNIPPFGKPYEVYLKRINIIEKATGKTWEEIKELTK